MARASVENTGSAGDKVSTRERIKAVAREMFIRHGLSEVSYGDIAERVGTTRANMHYHFGSKAELVATVFEETFEEVAASLQEIWYSPTLTLDDRLVCQYEDAVRRYYEFNDDDSGHSPWSLSARTYLSLDAELLSQDIRRGILQMMRQFEAAVNHAVRLAIGSRELHPDTPVEDVVLLIVPLWRYGTQITQSDGLRRLERHYQVVRNTIQRAYGAAENQ